MIEWIHLRFYKQIEWKYPYWLVCLKRLELTLEEHLLGDVKL